MVQRALKLASLDGKCRSRSHGGKGGKWIVYRSVNTTRKFAIISPIKIPPHLKCAFLPPFGDNLTIHLHSALAFQNGSEYHNVDFRLIGNHFCSSYRNLVRFGLVIWSLRRKTLYSQRWIFYWSYFIAYCVCNYQLMRIFIFCSDGFPFVFAPVFSTSAISTRAIYCLFHSRIFSAPRCVRRPWVCLPSRIATRPVPQLFLGNLVIMETRERLTTFWLVVGGETELVSLGVRLTISPLEGAENS